ncbi:MAG: aminotransferase class I/II-fold pyridoxal phosphate-dependent enzyme [Urechidicola sp.]|nr:aminotransferase class I/II-fold pyridoxal phosphate-dependent enzyme [Urechidicola sp.]
MLYNSKLPTLETTIFTVMSGLAQQYKAVNLSQGFPNFDCNPQLLYFVTDAMKNGFNQYAPMAGSIELRNEIAKKFEFLYQSTYHPESEITITAGATQAIYAIISAFIRKEDEVIIFKPAYDCYEPAIELNDGKVVPIQLNAPNYKVDWAEVEKNISPKTKMIIINTPQNPSGIVFSKDDLLQLQKLTNNTNIIVLSDEVYEHIIFDGLKHESICKFSDLKKRSFITASFGKTFHITGWKIGYCCAPKELMDEFRKVHQFNVFCVHHPSQVAIAKFLKEPNHYLKLSEFYQQKRDLFLELIKDSNFEFVTSQGTYFQNLRYSKITNERDVHFAKRLVTEYGIASIPLSVFNVNQQDDKMLRFCFAKTDDTLKQAAEILNRI